MRCMYDQFYDEALKDPVAGKGTALLEQGKTREGIQELRRASQEHPDNWYVWFCLGSALRLRADTREEAVAALQRAGELDTADTFYKNTATIASVGVLRSLEDDNVVLRAMKTQGTPSKTTSKCKKCGIKDTTTYKFGRKWICLDCVHDLIVEARSR